LSKEFNLNIEDTRANFEVYVKDYNSVTKEITLEILNIAKSDVSAITLEIENSSDVMVYGSKTRIIGDLDSNEYTTSDFFIASNEAVIPIKVLYTDAAGIRRVTQAQVEFSPENFMSLTPKSSPAKFYILGVLILGVGYFFYRKRRKKIKQ
jgi:LPXTG-motif cell wall-anchored protein